MHTRSIEKVYTLQSDEMEKLPPPPTLMDSIVAPDHSLIFVIYNYFSQLARYEELLADFELKIKRVHSFIFSEYSKNWRWG